MSNKKYIEKLVKEQIQILREEIYIWTTVGDQHDKAQLNNMVQRLKRKYERVKLKRIETSKFEEDLHDVLEVWIEDSTPTSNHNYLSTFMEMYPISKTYSGWRGEVRDMSRDLLNIMNITKMASEGDTSSVQYKINALNGDELANEGKKSGKVSFVDVEKGTIDVKFPNGKTKTYKAKDVDIYGDADDDIVELGDKVVVKESVN